MRCNNNVASIEPVTEKMSQTNMGCDMKHTSYPAISAMSLVSVESPILFPLGKPAVWATVRAHRTAGQCSRIVADGLATQLNSL